MRSKTDPQSRIDGPQTVPEGTYIIVKVLKYLWTTFKAYLMRFFLLQYTKKLPKNYQMDKKMYQIAVEYSKWP
jgi:hypothetical protein